MRIFFYYYSSAHPAMYTVIFKYTYAVTDTWHDWNGMPEAEGGVQYTVAKAGRRAHSRAHSSSSPLSAVFAGGSHFRVHYGGIQTVIWQAVMLFIRSRLYPVLPT
jgi:hypothetical protein